MKSIPALRGSYALRLVLPVLIRLSVGKLGEFDFPAGDYLYLGSAWGPGGLRARLLHHACPVSRPHWHLDWLRIHARPAGCWFTTAPGRLECAWAQEVMRLPGASVPAPGFGASDCHAGCPAHLLAFPHGIDCAAVEIALNRVKWGDFELEEGGWF